MSQPPGPQEPEGQQDAPSEHEPRQDRPGTAEGEDAPGAPARRRLLSLPWILGGAGALAVAVAAVVVVVVLGGGPGDAEETAQDAVDAMNAQDSDAMLDVLCEEAREQAEVYVGDTGEGPEPEFDVSVTLDGVSENDDTATADVTAHFDEIPAEWEGMMPEEQGMRLEMIVENGAWRICDLGFES